MSLFNLASLIFKVVIFELQFKNIVLKSFNFAFVLAILDFNLSKLISGLFKFLFGLYKL